MKKKKINRGIFANKQYTKYVSFSKAVLWKDRELSLRAVILAGFRAYGTTHAVFIDRGKGEKWIFEADEIRSKGRLKTVGQEQQWYFPIEMATKKKIKKMEDMVKNEVF